MTKIAEHQMNSISTFDITKYFLLDVMKDIKTGRIQLPDFQRDWVWDDIHVRRLLASISLAYPIGAVMMLQQGNQSRLQRWEAGLISPLRIIQEQNFII